MCPFGNIPDFGAVPRSKVIEVLPILLCDVFLTGLCGHRLYSHPHVCTAVQTCGEGFSVITY